MKQKTDIKVTVVIPVFNKRDYVEACLKSVLSQQFEGLEVIAVDDGSTDGSGDICDTMALNNPALRVIHVENGGVTAARRIGVEAARGEYITFVDSDDLVTEGGIKILYDAITSTKADEVVASYRTHHGETVTTGITGFVDTSWMLRELLASRARFCVLWAVMFRRGLLEGCLTAPRVIRSGEDILMQMMCLVKRPKVYFITDVVYEYTVDLPNDRRLNLEEQRAYDDCLHQALQPIWEEMKDHFILRQLKQYENFIAVGEFDVFDKYFRPLRRQLSNNIPLADRIAILLPPRLAFIPIKLRKILNHCYPVKH
ncbi:MAG: glycosyltransferase family 2 protein [Prevotella sp.]